MEEKATLKYFVEFSEDIVNPSGLTEEDVKKIFNQLKDIIQSSLLKTGFSIKENSFKVEFDLENFE